MADEKCGMDIIWNLKWNPRISGTYTLVLSGSGDMYDFGDAGAPWAAARDRISAVIIGGRITSIGNRAFMGCGQLASISLPTSLTRIGDEAFFGCYLLMYIPVPKGVTSIGYNAADCNAVFVMARNARHLRVTNDGRDIFEV